MVNKDQNGLEQFMKQGETATVILEPASVNDAEQLASARVIAMRESASSQFRLQSSNLNCQRLVEPGLLTHHNPREKNDRT
jgi:hypothetical protein